jgi:hypothetical protein
MTETTDVNRVVIPPEVLDLVRFMCATWTCIDRWAYENADCDALMKYPVIQGSRNQISLRLIGEQEHDIANIHKAVKWMLDEAVEDIITPIISGQESLDRREQAVLSDNLWDLYQEDKKPPSPPEDKK